MWCSTTAVFVCSCQDTFEHFEDTRDLHKLWNVPQTRTDEHYHFRTSSNKMQTVLNISWTGGCLGSQPLQHRKLAMLRSRSMGSREGWGQGNPSKVQDVGCIIDESGGTIPFPIRSQQKADSLGYSTGREVSAIAATASHQGGHF